MKAYQSEGAVCFVWNPHELAQAAPGWLPPQELRPEPVMITVANPFTGKTETRPSFLFTEAPPSPTGDPPGILDLSTYPFCSLRGLQPWDMAYLAELLLGCPHWEAYERWTQYLNGPDDASDILLRCCPLTCEALTALPRQSLNGTALAWASAGGINPDDAKHVLENLAPFLTAAAQTSREPYLWTDR